MGQKKKKIYAVAQGLHPGIYKSWFGLNGAEAQIKGYPNALFKGFESHQEATEWLEAQKASSEPTQRALPISSRKPKESSLPPAPQAPVHSQPLESLLEADPTSLETTDSKSSVTIYTDGGAIRNPGPGGYGTVLMYGKHKKEISGGYRHTTNNRMELMACIVGLQHLKRPCIVTLFSDSRYVVNGMTKGWAKKWRSKGWMRTKDAPAANADLWAQLLELSEGHTITFRWVKGHAGNPGNERCDALATQAAKKDQQPADIAYEQTCSQLGEAFPLEEGVAVAAPRLPVAQPQADPTSEAPPPQVRDRGNQDLI